MAAGLERILSVNASVSLYVSQQVPCAFLITPPRHELSTRSLFQLHTFIQYTMYREVSKPLAPGSLTAGSCRGSVLCDWQSIPIRAMLSQMGHGGTNFGFNSGANIFSENDYRPVITSYDYVSASPLLADCRYRTQSPCQRACPKGNLQLRCKSHARPVVPAKRLPKRVRFVSQ